MKKLFTALVKGEARVYLVLLVHVFNDAIAPKIFFWMLKVQPPSRC